MVDCVKEIVGLSLCLCAVDGLVSDIEESELKKEILKTYPNVDVTQIDKWIDEFFDSDLKIEEYAMSIPDHASRLSALRIGTYAAASDGLDLKESISLLKVCSLYGFDIEGVLND